MQITKNTSIEIINKIGKECDRCNNCCSYDTGIVLEKDIPIMAKHFKLNLEKFKKTYLVEHERFNKKCYKFKQIKTAKTLKPFGKCVMLDDKLGCIIHTVKPLHCRVCSAKSKQGKELTQWFALNYLVDINNPESIRQWAVYLKYNKSINGGELKDLIPDCEKLKRILGYEILK
jgi:Fe-S-cluster containining protein